MDANLYVNILDEFLVPFIRQIYPHDHRFMQDNDPKYTTRRNKEIFEKEEINWLRQTPERPNANSNENLWHELKVSSAY